MKLVIQIPALNERDTIGQVIDDLPRAIPGIAQVTVLIIDDGCTDDTVMVALQHGADHVVRHTSNKGLATAYQTGIDTALRLGADIIVNTDGDHQYPGSEIPRLIEPILQGRADVVIGDRQVQQNEHFSPFKKALQHVGSSVVRWASDTDVPDTVSGFRALTREAALRTFVTTDFSYTVESLIQAGKRRLTVVTVPIRTNLVERPSKLHKGNWHFIKRQGAIIVRTYTRYEPLKVFTYVGGFFFIISVLFWLRASYVFFGRRLFGLEESNDQSLLIGGVFLIIALFTFFFGLLADWVGSVRRLEEEVLYRVRSTQVQDDLWRQTLERRLDDLERSLAPDAPPLAVGERRPQAAQPVAPPPPDD